MTPKEKAEELILKYRLIEFDKTEYTRLLISLKDAKECALIAVDEILQGISYGKLIDSPYTTLEARQYFVAVKQEIEKL